jgi:hypothetical protein
MTYRDRRERKANRLRDYAERREARQDTLSDAARGDEATTGIPFGQPILVGHHSERRHRAAIARMDRAMGASVENSRKAAAMRARADEIERQADRAIYDDDPDAIERLQAKLAKLEAKRERMKTTNAAYRKEHRAELKAMSAYERGQAVPFPSYAISNLGGVIATTRQRIERLSRPESGRVMVANRGGDCRNCRAGIKAGQTIRWFRRAGEAEHVRCPKETT